MPWVSEGGETEAEGLSDMIGRVPETPRGLTQLQLSHEELHAGEHVARGAAFSVRGGQRDRQPSSRC